MIGEMHCTYIYVINISSEDDKTIKIYLSAYAMHYNDHKLFIYTS